MDSCLKEKKKGARKHERKKNEENQQARNHGRGLALTMGLASMHVCVLLEFVERLYAGIDGFNVCILL